MRNDPGNNGGPVVGRYTEATTEARMRAFDRLPKYLREEINYADNQWCPLGLERALRDLRKKGRKPSREELLALIREQDEKKTEQVNRLVADQMGWN